jgi:hypothetical protein
MRNWWGVAALVAAMVLFPIGLERTVVRAQDETPTPPKQVTVAPGITVAEGEPFVLYVNSTTVNPQGQFADARPYLLLVDGTWTRLTACDDVVVACAPLPIRVADVSQGDTFVLTGEGS